MARRHTREIEVDLSDFSDEEILAEAAFRGLTVLPIKPTPDATKIAADVQALLCCHHDNRALVAMRELICELLPANVYAAHEAMAQGRYSEAICHLESFLYPSKAATATKLPKPKPAETPAP